MDLTTTSTWRTNDQGVQPSTHPVTTSNMNSTGYGGYGFGSPKQGGYLNAGFAGGVSHGYAYGGPTAGSPSKRELTVQDFAKKD